MHAKPAAASKPPKQTQLQLTYSVGDWVFAKTNWGKLPRLLARIESATPIATANGDCWLVRVYYSRNRKALSAPSRRKVAPIVGWSPILEHRHIDRALNPAEIVDMRNAGIIPPAGSAVLP